MRSDDVAWLVKLGEDFADALDLELTEGAAMAGILIEAYCPDA